MDGHGGEHVARFCERHLPLEIARGSPSDPEATFQSAFHRMDEMLADPANLSEFRWLKSPGASPQAALRSWLAHPDDIGATALVAAVERDHIVVANGGDSRAVLCRGGRAMDLSQDHKPNLPAERERIARAGGSVQVQHFGPVTQYRVNGGLNLSRSIGDLNYKSNPGLSPLEQLIVATPDVRTFPRQSGDEFMVLACDGIWDVLSSQEVVEFVRVRLGPRHTLRLRLQMGHVKLSTILEELLDTCISPNLAETFGIGGDNMTAVLVVFLPSPNVQPDIDLDSSHDDVLTSQFAPSWFCAYRNKLAC
jgi:protein phosphatase 1G